MKKLFIIVFLVMLVFSCFPIHKSNSNDNSVNVDNFGHGQIHNVQVRNFSEIPKGLLDNINEMGKDSSSILNEYEGKYLNFIFKIDTNDFNLVGKKVGFLGSKKDYFKQTQERFSRISTTVGASGLYIFNDTQKEESGGYDAAIVYWSKKLLTMEEVVKRLKRKH